MAKLGCLNEPVGGGKVQLARSDKFSTEGRNCENLLLNFTVFTLLSWERKMQGKVSLHFAL